MKNKNTDKMYVVTYTFKAKSIKDAIKQVKKREPDEVYISDLWKSGANENLATAIGFGVETPRDI